MAILAAGITCGVLDGISASVAGTLLGSNPVRVFQGIAFGLLGRDVFQGGVATALLGVGLHFVVAIGAAATYYLASRWLPVMLDRALLCGVVFGGLSHFFMNFVVIPLSAIGSRPIVPKTFIIFLLISMVVVGPAISLTLRRWLVRPRGAASAA